MTRIGRLVALLAAAFICVAAGGAMAQKAPAIQIATMDSQQILRDAKAAQSVATQIRVFIGQLEKLAASEEAALKARQEQYRQQAAILAPEAQQQRQQELQKAYTDAQRLLQERRNAIDRVRQQAFEVMKAQILAIIEELQKERAFQMVLDRSSYSWAAPELDITPEIIQRLDRRLPAVTVDKPQGF